MQKMLICLCFLLFPICLIAEPKFIKEPKVVMNNENTKISFEVSEETDVTVAVYGEDKKIIKHIAAGRIGKEINSPKPLKTGLSQELNWDFTDDFGKKVRNSEYEIKVSIGASIIFDGFIGEDPYLFGSIHSMCVDEDNHLYLMSYAGGYNQNMDTLREFSANGKYVKTLIPFSEKTPKEGIANIASWNEIRKTFMPNNLRSQLPEFYPWGAGAHIVSASKKSGFVFTKENKLYTMNYDGTNVQGPIPLWNPKANLKNPAWNIPQFAKSPDGKYLYIANVAGTRYKPKDVDDFDKAWPQGRIYRRDLTKSEEDPHPFFDLKLPDYAQNKYWLPDAWNKRTAAYNVSVDKKGNVYICDLVNQAIVEVDPNGKEISSTPVQWPEAVHVDDEGNYFVISRAKQPLDGYVPKILNKVNGRGSNSKIVATLSLEKWHSLGSTSLLVTENKKSTIWLGGGNSLVCFQEDSGKFNIVETEFKQNLKNQQDWNRLTTDYYRNEIYASNGTNLIYKYSGETGKGGELQKNGKTFKGVDIAVGYDGSLYIRTGESYSGPLERFTYDLEPFPFSTGTNVLTKYVYSRYGVGNCEKGLGVGPKGECYINFMFDWNQYFIAGFDQDGKVMKGNYLQTSIKPDVTRGAPPDQTSAIIGPIPAANGGVKVDLEGNIYIGLRLLPKEFKAATGYEKNRAYTTWTGCIAKFPANGGTVVPSKDTKDGIEANRNSNIVGALKLYPGAAPFSGDEYGSGGSCCVCRVPRFDVDRFGRITYTNAVTNSAVVVDNEGNLLYEFGQYGNFDAQYQISSESEKNDSFIPLAWPIGAGFTQNHIYIMDAYNRRIVKTSYKYVAEKKIEVVVKTNDVAAK